VSPAPDFVGLCAGCVHTRVVESRRGSRFRLCQRSRTDPTFPRYPNLPVRACRGFQPASARTAPDTPERSNE
jgi:hypothetical protein